MAFIQITLIKFKEGTSPQRIAQVKEGLKRISSIVSGVKRFEFGADLKLESASMDFGLIIEFDGPDSWNEYREHPDHVAFANETMKIIEKVKRVQMQT